MDAFNIHRHLVPLRSDRMMCGLVECTRTGALGYYYMRPSDLYNYTVRWADGECYEMSYWNIRLVELSNGSGRGDDARDLVHLIQRTGMGDHVARRNDHTLLMCAMYRLDRELYKSFGLPEPEENMLGILDFL